MSNTPIPPKSRTGRRTPCPMNPENLAPKFEVEKMLSDMESDLSPTKAIARNLVALGAFQAPTPKTTPQSATPQSATPSSVTLGTNDTESPEAPPAPKRPRVAGGHELAGVRMYFSLRAYESAEGRYRVVLEYYTGGGQPVTAVVANSLEMDESFNIYTNLHLMVMQANADRGIVIAIPSRPVWR